jgi:hypothetical protein
MGLRVSLDGVMELHRDVSAECFNLQLCIAQTLLNHVPDADKTDKRGFNGLMPHFSQVR